MDPAAVIQAGATEIHSSFPADDVPGIVGSYLHGLRAVYVMVIALSGAATFVAMMNRWQKLDLKE